MTDDERRLLLELTGTLKIILEGRNTQRTLQDFKEVVGPLYARVFDAAAMSPVQP